MAVLLKIKWSDMPDAEKFTVEAIDQPPIGPVDRKLAQSFRFETENNVVLFYFDNNDSEWRFITHAVRFDGTRHRIKCKIDSYEARPSCKARLGFNEIPDNFYERSYLMYGIHGDKTSSEGISKTCGGGRDWIGAGADEPVIKNGAAFKNHLMVLEAGGHITDDTAKALKNYILTNFGKDQKVMVLGDGLKVTLLPIDAADKETQT